MNQKILVDDHSTGNTIKIARQFNWSIYTNPSTGIPSGANEAKAWWSKIPKHLLNETVAAASDIRVVNQPTALRKLEEHRKILREKFLYPTRDNTMYKTEIIQKLGGFTKLYISGSVDIVLAKRLYSKEYMES